MSSSRSEKGKYHVFHLGFHYQAHKETHVLPLLKNLQSPDRKKNNTFFFFQLTFQGQQKDGREEDSEETTWPRGFNLIT